MFGLADRLYVRKKWEIIREDIDWHPVTKSFNSSNDSWYCFVPKIVIRDERVKVGILPKTGKLTYYIVSSINLTTSNPQEMLRGLREIYDDAVGKIKEDLFKGMKISLLGISLGNVISTRLAGSLNNGKIKNLVSLVGGARLGLSAWDSLQTGRIAQNSGVTTKEEYEEILKEFSPIEYTSGINPDNIFARFGSADLMIRYNPHGKDLRRALESIGAGRKDIKTYLFADHSSSIILSSMAGIHDTIK